MFSSIIMLTNLLIAMMSTTYEEVKDHADVEYKFALVQLIDRSNSLPLVPPPLNLFVLPFALLGSVLRSFPVNVLGTQMWGSGNGDTSVGIQTQDSKGAPTVGHKQSNPNVASLRLKHMRDIALLRRQQQFEENERKRIIRETLIKRAYSHWSE